MTVVKGSEHPPVHVLQEQLHVERIHVHEVDGLLLALGLGQDGPQQRRGRAQDDGVRLQRHVTAGHRHVGHGLALAQLLHESERTEAC